MKSTIERRMISSKSPLPNILIFFKARSLAKASVYWQSLELQSLSVWTPGTKPCRNIRSALETAGARGRTPL